MNLSLKITVFFLTILMSCSSGERAGKSIVKKKAKPTIEIETYVVNPLASKLRFYWKSDSGAIYKSIKSLKDSLAGKGENLTFAMNGGMYLKDHSPQGLYIEEGEVLKKKDTTQTGYGNFYMQPNGIFSLNKNGKAEVVTSSKFQLDSTINYATQSGPMLLVDGALHPRFIKGSTSLFVRNGVGILPNGDVLFAISKEKINFYDFAMFFKDKGCEQALYLDGFVSKMYLPSKNWDDEGGRFGVIIGEVE